MGYSSFRYAIRSSRGKGYGGSLTFLEVMRPLLLPLGVAGFIGYLASVYGS